MNFCLTGSKTYYIFSNTTASWDHSNWVLSVSELCQNFVVGFAKHQSGHFRGYWQTFGLLIFRVMTCNQMRTKVVVLVIMATCVLYWCYFYVGWLVRMEWHPAGSACLPLLIFPCTTKSRSSLLAPAHPGGPRKRGRPARKMVVLCVCYMLALYLLF